MSDESAYRSQHPNSLLSKNLGRFIDTELAFLAMPKNV
jgi:hypothetical protein